MMVKKTKSNTLKKDATLALANLLLIGALTDNSAKAESKKDDTDLKLVSHNVYMLSTVLYPNWGQYKRAYLIGQSSYIKNNDVVIFNEAFDNGASDKLLSNVKKNILTKHLYSVVLNQVGTKLKVATHQLLLKMAA